jgi:hypothetical protein
MTAVEWIIDWMGKNQYFIGNDLLEAVKQAKQMEADQIISAHESASLDAGYENSAREWAENYYKLKFKKK